MSLGADLLRAFGQVAVRRVLPRVRALHLPQTQTCGRKQSAFCALELDDGTIGLAYVGLGDVRNDLSALDTVRGGDPLDLLRGCAQPEGAARVLGFATANALTRWLFDRAGFVPPASRDSLGGIAAAPGVRVGMVGLFLPLIDRVVQAGADLTVLELPPEVPGDRGGWRLTLEPRDLAACSVVLCTSTVLLNDTLDEVRTACRAARSFVLIGPGAGCLPDPLFARGVTRLGGSWVLEPAAVVAALQDGRTWTEHVRKFELDRADYPGLAALLARL